MRYFILGVAIGALVVSSYDSIRLSRLSDSEDRAIKLANLYASVLNKSAIYPDEFEVMISQMLVDGP